MLTVEQYKRLDRMLADAPDLRVKVLPAHKPTRSFAWDFRAVDLARPITTSLLIATGLQADVGGLAPLTDDEGFEMKLGKINFLTPPELAEVLAAHERRIAPMRGLIGKRYLMSNEAEWRKNLTPFLVVVGDDIVDFRAVMSAAGVTEKDKRGMVTAELRNLVTSTAGADPALTAAWCATEHAYQLSQITGHVVMSDEPVGDLERMLAKEGIEIANRRGETFASHRAWWASKVMS